MCHPTFPSTFRLENGRQSVIRYMTEDDAEQLCALLPQMHRESDFLNYLPGEFDKTIEQEKEFIREHKAKPCSIALVAELDGRIIALGGAAGGERKRFAHHAEFGLVVLKEFWGQGLGRRIAQLILEWGRTQGLRKMYLKVFAHNQHAIGLYRSLGFVEEGRLKDDVLRGDGSYTDTIIMARSYVN